MLEGRRVSLRPVTTDDAALLAAWHSDREYVGEQFNVWPQTAQLWAREAERKPTSDDGLFVVIDRETSEPLGTVGYWVPSTRPDLFGGVELWYRVHPKHRKRGVATDSVCLIVNHLFDATPIPRVQASVVVGNESSCRVAEKAGMRRDGIYRSVFFLHGRWVDTHLYAIVRDDWVDEATYRRLRAPF